MKRNIVIFFAVFVFTAQIFSALDLNSALESKSSVDWTKNDFYSSISLDVRKQNLNSPASKNAAEALIKLKMPSLVKDPLLTLFVDNSNYLGDIVSGGSINLEQITEIIEDGKRNSPVFSADAKTLNTTNIIKITNLSAILVRHQYPYTAQEPLDSVPSRAYTGIIIDARGTVPVHGEYIESEVYPCFFPQIWDDNMNLIYERNMIDRNIASARGIVRYDYSDDDRRYEDVTGTDPLYIKAYKVYGRNRTDPILRRRDALKILTVPENLELLKSGKVAILLDKKNLIYSVGAPEKDSSYYAAYRTLKQYIYENKVPDIDVSDSINGILFSVDLKFFPDSPELLPEERSRISKVAEMLEEIIKNNEFTILVEGHTADVGKPVGQMNLSIERTRTVMNALIAEGLPRNLFTYKGYGATQPIADNATEEGRKQNRRVDITARPRASYIQRN
ncbi:MAG: OmpA family protein [Treponema sp.]